MEKDKKKRISRRVKKSEKPTYQGTEDSVNYQQMVRTAKTYRGTLKEGDIVQFRWIGAIWTGELVEVKDTIVNVALKLTEPRYIIRSLDLGKATNYPVKRSDIVGKLNED